jgi:beta-glucanase (GH16 family)
MAKSEILLTQLSREFMIIDTVLTRGGWPLAYSLWNCSNVRTPSPQSKISGSHHRGGWLTFWCVLLMVALLADPAITISKHHRPRAELIPPQQVWRLVFQDEFDGTVLNEQLWETQFPWGRDRSAVGELQLYAPDAFRVANGTLSIEAAPLPPGASHPYASGIITSHKSFATRFGRFEIRCKVPKGKGLWPAFWLLPTDTSWPPEIDVFEVLGDSTNTVHMTSHWLENGEHHKSNAEFSGPDFSAGFHTFALEWSKTSIVWFVDGIERHRIENRGFRGEMYLLANLAVGGSWPGAPDASTVFPSTFQIDYIRAYQSDPVPSAGPDQDPGDKHKNKKKRKRKRNRHKGRSADVPRQERFIQWSDPELDPGSQHAPV